MPSLVCTPLFCMFKIFPFPLYLSFILHVQNFPPFLYILLYPDFSPQAALRNTFEMLNRSRTKRLLSLSVFTICLTALGILYLVWPETWLSQSHCRIANFRYRRCAMLREIEKIYD